MKGHICQQIRQAGPETLPPRTVTPERRAMGAAGITVVITTATTTTAVTITEGAAAGRDAASRSFC